MTMYAQTSTRQKMDQVKNNPATTEKAAKADAELINKKGVTDSSQSKAVIRDRRQQFAERFKRKKLIK